MRVLVVRVGAMGDVLHGLPAVCALRERHPAWVLGWAVDPRWAPLVAGTGQVVDRVHRVETSLWKRAPFSLATLRSILALRRELRAERYDLCVDLQGTLRSAVTGWMSGARRRMGPAVPRERAALNFYTARVRTRATHVIDQACEQVSAATGRWPAEVLRPAAAVLPSDAEAELWCDRAVEQVCPPEPMNEPTHHDAAVMNGARSFGGFVLLVPGAGWGAKCWPAERFIELARQLRAEGLRVLVNAASADDPLAMQVAGASGAETIGCDVAQLVALVRRASVVVGGDTGPVHMAGALGRPVVALFGPTDPARNGPGGFPGARVTTLRGPASVTSYKRRAEMDAGLARITVADVLAAVHARLNAGTR